VNPFPISRHRSLFSLLMILSTLAMGACRSTLKANPSPANPTAATPAAPGPTDILPVAANPMSNTATPRTLTIDSVLVENNLDVAGNGTDDHLEIALSNSGTSDLSSVEVFYTFRDAVASVSESYYARLPIDFVIPAGGRRVAHFDSTGLTDHFPVNKFSLYKTSAAELDVTVVVSAAGAALQTKSLKKDAGSAEAAD
jgi:hypothetical protein